MSVVIAMVNMKGGVGKTTTTVNLAGAYATAGEPTLLVDLDPQASSTRCFWGTNRVKALEERETVAATFAGRRLMPHELIRPSGIAHLDLVPGSHTVDKFNAQLPVNSPVHHRQGVREFLSRAKAKYTRVFLDCPPNLYVSSFAAMMAADYVLVPVIPDDPGVQGVRDLMDNFALVQAENPALELAGILYTRVTKAQAHSVFANLVRDENPGKVFEATIPASVSYTEAFMARQPITLYSKSCAAAKAIKAVAAELDARVAALRAARDQRSEIIGTLGVA